VHLIREGFVVSDLLVAGVLLRRLGGVLLLVRGLLVLLVLPIVLLLLPSSLSLWILLVPLTVLLLLLILPSLIMLLSLLLILLLLLLMVVLIVAIVRPVLLQLLIIKLVTLFAAFCDGFQKCYFFLLRRVAVPLLLSLLFFWLHLFDRFIVTTTMSRWLLLFLFPLLLLLPLLSLLLLLDKFFAHSVRQLLSLVHRLLEIFKNIIIGLALIFFLPSNIYWEVS